ncbi:MAG: BatD family protein, partial [Planctomycetales bacterium]|nr:BatD family protein [Planctomycetales bacterium]
RAGTFVIPSFPVDVNGQTQHTQPLRFVATKSETGDLLFVQIEGGNEKVFVGQPLDLKLRIWIKPFVDRDTHIKLSEGDMWRMISDQTAWGSFGERLQKMAENEQRPGGSEVLRDDGNGSERAYYLYEIDATVYPKRPGKIDADDVQIVVNYPIALSNSRDAFDGFFKNSPFGGRDPFAGFGGSRLSQMMGDDFFSSPFGNRLTVTSARPIVAQAEVDATQVVPVPAAGRPADYRGAVGSYQIVTQATPTHVSAGDPITLQIGIAGTGPMELVQAPPLTELPSLTKDFKVEDQSLAGFVRDDTKVFPTTIRPRREGITTIPPIPFSFFDPDKETFHTVMSEPIAITVDKAESLALDAIVGSTRQTSQGDDSLKSLALQPSFTNNDSVTVLDSQAARTAGSGWLALVILPPVVWLGALIVCHRQWLINFIVASAERFQSADTRCLQAINRATRRDQIDAALLRFVSSQTRSAAAHSTPQAIGALRTCGMYSIAADLESFLSRADDAAYRADESFSLEKHRRQARDMVAQLSAAFAGLSKSQVRRSARPSSSSKAIGRTAAMLFIVAGTLVGWSSNTFASDGVAGMDGVVTESAPLQPNLELTRQQQELILADAAALYAKATGLSETDKAGANELLTQAAAKYQMLVDSGIRNSDLYFNLGNAYLQSNQLGRAIAAYEQAKTIDPWNRQLAANLDFANSLVKGDEPVARDSAEQFGVAALLRQGNDTVTQWFGKATIVWTLGIASMLFWGLLTIGIFRPKLPMKRLAAIPLAVLLLTAVSVGLAPTRPVVEGPGVIVANRIALRSGDGEQFSELVTISPADGHRVDILTERAGWMQIQTRQEQKGWVPSSTCIRTNSHQS